MHGASGVDGDGGALGGASLTGGPGRPPSHPGGGGRDPYAAHMASDAHETVADLLRRDGQRYTTARRGLVRMLLGLTRPATIAELGAIDPAQSQSSLYRNLAVLERCGAVHRLSSVDGVSRFELSEDLSHHHHHLACERCGRLEDVVLPPPVEATLHRVTAELGDAHGYDVTRHALELLGVCADCRAEPSGGAQG